LSFNPELGHITDLIDYSLNSFDIDNRVQEELGF